YSSINGNDFGGYGEVAMGTNGTLALHRERDAMLFRKDTNTSLKIAKKEKGVSVDTYETGGAAVATETKAYGAYPPSRGYREEMEHWAWCVRNRDPENQPRCKPEVALADAVLALTANIAVKKGIKIPFHPDWFDPEKPRTPEGDYGDESGKKSV
ncbi:MAG: gfo/Idh/MocA family oxidoreductase, partial [Planctomycetales bacterium]